MVSLLWSIYPSHRGGAPPHGLEACEHERGGEGASRLRNGVGVWLKPRGARVPHFPRLEPKWLLSLSLSLSLSD